MFQNDKVSVISGGSAYGGSYSVEENHSGGPEKKSAEAQFAGRPLRLLMVEDNEADAELLVSFLEFEGHQVESQRVETKEAFRTALESQDWDVIISDHRLPRFSGREALQIFQESGIDIPFMVVSGTMGEQTAIEYMRAGARDYLLKGDMARLGPALRRELQEAMIRRSGRDAEEARRESQAQYRQIVEAASEGIFMVNTRSRLTFANRRLVEILGRELQTLMGESIFNYIDPADVERARARWRKRPGKSGEHLEVRLVRADATVVWTQISVSALKDHQGNWLGSLGMVTDITESKLLQQRVLRAEVEKKLFCRQVLAAVTGGKFHLVDNSELPDAGKVAVDIPLDCETNYRGLLRQIREVGETYGLDAEAAGDFTLAVGEAATNALKHARSGRGQIRVLEDRLIARISDQGEGMRADDIPASILQPGFSTAVSLGMGYTIMLEMSDTIWLASGPDGTVVQLERSLRPRTPEIDLSLLDRFS